MTNTCFNEASETRVNLMRPGEAGRLLALGKYIRHFLKYQLHAQSKTLTKYFDSEKLLCIPLRKLNKS